MDAGASGEFTVDKAGKFTDIASMSGIEQLLKVARRYGEIEGVPLTTVSSRALNDGKKLDALERGADINVSRLERALSWFSENWPEGDWPPDVPRPSPSLAEARA
jgi:hypothetical protein